MSTGGDAESQARRAAAAARREIAAFEVPSWLRTIGIGSWLTLGVAGVIALGFLVVALVADVAIPLAIAAVLAAILVPLTDRLERARVPRWLGATLVLVLGLLLAAGTIALVINGIAAQADMIWARLDSGLEQVNTDAAGGDDSTAVLVGGARSFVHLITRGVLGSLVSSAGALIVGSVLALFMLLFLLKDWSQITGWVSGHLGVPAPVGEGIVDGVVDAFRGYAKGLTLIGAANAAVVAVGAWLMGVPLVGTIALVSFVTSYVPYLGAFVAGAFTVLIAYGAEGFATAMVMLVVVVLANNTIQNLLEPFAFGRRLRLHPLVVLITVTSATVLFGILGAVLAAPLASAGANAYHQVRDAGLLGPPPDDGDAN